MKYINSYDCVLGKLYIAEENNKITNIFIEKPQHFKEFLLEETVLIKTAKKQLTEYFEGSRKVFTLPLGPEGTLFQKKVWDALLTIPYGKTCSYSDIAALIDNPKACRAIGGANGKNPIPIIIPCHRVIGKNGTLVGYTGGLHIKKQLLFIEGLI